MNQFLKKYNTNLLKKSKRTLRKKITVQRVRLEMQNQYTTLPKLIEISPQLIKWKSTFSRSEFPTKDSAVQYSYIHLGQPVVGVIDGAWDKYIQKWENTTNHKSLVERFEHGADWEDTELYKKNLKKIEKSEVGQHGVTSVKDLNQRCNDIDSLYCSMKENGYIPQRQLISDSVENNSSKNPPSEVEILGHTYPDECRVGINRNGEFIRFSAARHRISLAKILGLENVPVLIVVRHKKWDEIRNEFMYSDSAKEIPVEYRQFSNHPDVAE